MNWLHGANVRTNDNIAMDTLLYVIAALLPVAGVFGAVLSELAAGNICAQPM